MSTKKGRIVYTVSIILLVIAVLIFLFKPFNDIRFAPRIAQPASPHPTTLLSIDCDAQLEHDLNVCWETYNPDNLPRPPDMNQYMCCYQASYILYYECLGERGGADWNYHNDAYNRHCLVMHEQPDGPVRLWAE